MAAGVVGIGSMTEAGTTPDSSNISSSKGKPNIRIGVIGVRRQGLQLAESLASLARSTVVAICDIDETVRINSQRKIAERQPRVPRLYSDYRRLLEASDVDAVVIATPDHWHTPMLREAVSASKDVYLESPVTHSRQESELLRAELLGTSQVIGVGLQQRSGAHFLSAIELLKTSGIGDVKMARAWAVHQRPSLNATQKPLHQPRGVDYDAWLGPGEKLPFDLRRFHHHWRWQWAFGSGELGNWGVHLLDIARWGLDVDLPDRVIANGAMLGTGETEQTPDTLHVQFCYDERMILWEHRNWSPHGMEGRSNGVAFYGSEGTLIVDRGGWKVYGQKNGPSADASPLIEPHLENWLDAIEERRQPSVDLQTALVSADLCHLANDAYRNGLSVDSL